MQTEDAGCWLEKKRDGTRKEKGDRRLEKRDE